MLSDMDEGTKQYQNLEQVDHLVNRIANVVKKIGQVRRYQILNYCGGVNVLDFDASSKEGS